MLVDQASIYCLDICQLYYTVSEEQKFCLDECNGFVESDGQCVQQCASTIFNNSDLKCLDSTEECLLINDSVFGVTNCTAACDYYVGNLCVPSCVMYFI